MKKYIHILFIFVLSCNDLYSQKTSSKSDLDLYDLFGIAIKNINFSSSISEDSIINICNNLKEKYRLKEKIDTVYGISEMEINSLCLKGDMGLAINKANSMYEDAKRNQNQLGIGLAFQAIGETYLHSNQFQQAKESFNEADKYIEKAKIPYAQLRLLIQQMYVNMELNDMPQLQKNIFKTIEVSENIPKQFQKDIHFYISCYQTLHAIGTGESNLAGEYLRKTLQINFPSNHYDVWKFYINSRYYELIGNYEQALAYNASVLGYLEHRNPNAYIKFAIHRAGLYEKHKELKQACDIYTRIDYMSDSLNMTQYTSQVDSLRVVYWVDQMNIENAVSHNRMLTMIMFYGIIILVIMAVLIRFARKRNRLLRESQKKLSEKRYEVSDSIQSKSLLLSNMSHELRTPLSTIVSFCGLLADNYKRDKIDTKLKQQCIEVINKNSDLLFKRLNDITSISDLRDMKINFTWNKLDAVPLCRNIVNSMDKGDKASVLLQFKTDLKHLVIETDQEYLKQILDNLLTNALKFTSKGRITLELSLLKEDGIDMAQFTVEDTGCGIPPEKQPALFQGLEKLHEKKQGIDLGLSIIYQVITNHLGGKIGLDSSYKQGARFIFTHPVKRTLLEEPAKQ